MGSAFRIARIKGIDIKVHVTFALTLAWAALNWGLLQGLGWAGAFYGVLLVGLLFVCVTLHELAHSLVAQRFGAKVRDITLLPIGGVASLEDMPKKPSHEFWMALAGPAVNIILAVLIGAFVLPLLGWRALSGLGLLLRRLNDISLERLSLDLLTANVGLAIFNLLPAFPMDGGRVLRALLASQMGELDATRIATRVGQGLAMLLGLAGFATGAWNLMLVAGFVFFGAEQEWRGTQVAAALRQVPVEAALVRGGVILSPYEPLARAINVTLQSGQADFAVFDRGYLVGMLTREKLADGFRRYGADEMVDRVMTTDFPVASANENLLDLQRKMQASGSPAISVMEGGQFLGLVTLESVRNALRLFYARGWRVVGT